MVAKSPASTKSFRVTMFPKIFVKYWKFSLIPKRVDNMIVLKLKFFCQNVWGNGETFILQKAKFLWYFCHLDLFLHHYYQIKTPLKWSKKFLKPKMEWISWKVENGFAILIQTSDLGTLTWKMKDNLILSD